jgi:hypothetical protein
VFWLTLTFASFGLFCATACHGPRGPLPVWMDTPFDGLLKVSAEPFRYAYAHLNQ